jgi:hypothetical protein
MASVIEFRKSMLEQIAEIAANPTYNQLEVGFRHSPLRTSEIDQRLREALELISELADHGLSPALPVVA